MTGAETPSAEVEAFLADAIAKVQSPGVREWARSAHNAPILFKIAKGHLDKRPAGGWSREDAVLRFSSWLVCTAMGF